jgi:iron complex outermembrane receptor protein
LGKKWDLQAGFRAEHTKSLGDLTSYKHNDLDKVDTTYLNFFPSGAISFRASKNHTWNLNYSRRINRPSYQNLNPFEYRIDELVYSKGNPFLKTRIRQQFQTFARVQGHTHDFIRLPAHQVPGRGPAHSLR